MKKVVITADSSSDIPPELAARLDVGITPLSIVVGDKSFSDGVDITPDEIYSFVENDGLMPHTASVTPAAYADFFSRYTRQGCAIVHICLSSAISSTYQNAVISAKAFEDVYPIDSLSLHTGIMLQILRACDLRDQGLEAKEIARILDEDRLKVRTTFIVSRLDYLAKGGRCSSITALGANLLGIRPSIDMTGGALKVGKKYRGKMQTCFEQYARDCLSQPDKIDKKRVTVSHSGVSQDIVDSVVDIVKQCVDFEEVYVVRAGCTITSHCGPNTMAVIYMTK